MSGEDTTDEKETPDVDSAPARRRERMSPRDAAARGRKLLAQVLWLICLLAAIFLAVGALLVVLKANQDNDLVKFVLRVADTVDLGIFSRDNGIKQFHGHDADIKDALFNWGLGAVAWLVAGRILERIVRPR